jgi:hypothetical protein
MLETEHRCRIQIRRSSSPFILATVLTELSRLLLVIFNIVRYMCCYRRGLDWWMDLLTTNAYISKLRTFTTVSLIATIHKSPQHPLTIFQHAVSSAVPWQRLLTVEILQLHALRFYLHSLPCRTLSQLSINNWQLPGCRPFHTNLLVVSSQADFQLTLFFTTSRTQLNSQLNWSPQLSSR